MLKSQIVTVLFLFCVFLLLKEGKPILSAIKNVNNLKAKHLKRILNFSKNRISLSDRKLIRGSLRLLGQNSKELKWILKDDDKVFNKSTSRDPLPPPENYLNFSVSEDCRRDTSLGILNAFKMLENLLGPVNELFNEPLNEILIAMENLTDPNNNTVSGIIQMIDAFFKVPPGILEGNFHWLGSWDLCNNALIPYKHWYMDMFFNGTTLITYDDDKQYKGRYCRLAVVPTEDLGSDNDGFLPFEFGICMPNSCNETEVGSIIQKGLSFSNIYKYDDNVGVFNPHIGGLDQLLGLSVSESFCGNYWYSVFDYKQGQAVVGAFAVILIIIIFSTVYEIIFRESFLRMRVNYLDNNSNKLDACQVSKEPRRKISNMEDELKERGQTIFNTISIRDRLEYIFNGFSIYNNMRDITNTKYARGDIPCLNALRFLSFGWAVVGNSYVFGILVAEVLTTSNVLNAIPKLLKRWSFQIVINYHFNMDTFFTISGFLVAYTFINKYTSIKKINVKVIILFYFHRWWRLVVPLMFIVGFFAYFYKQLGDGPIYGITVTDAENCKKTWWTNLILFHNILKKDNRCLAWTFYIGVLWQLYIISPFILIPFVYKQFLGFTFLLIFYVAHIISTAIISSLEYENGFGGWFSELLTTPWCRAGPYLIGMLFALLYDKKDIVANKINGLIAIICWLISFLIIGLCTFITLDQFNKDDVIFDPWNKTRVVVYDTLARSGFSVAIVWIIFACTSGYGGALTRCFRWRLFVPLYKLLYPSMLIHPIFIFRYIYNKRILAFIEDFEVIYLFFGHTMISYAVGLVVALLFWYPFLNIEKGFTLTKFELFNNMKQYIRNRNKRKLLS